MQSPSPAAGTIFFKLPWLHLQNFHFSESDMEAISNQGKIFQRILSSRILSELKISVY